MSEFLRPLPPMTSANQETPFPDQGMQRGEDPEDSWGGGASTEERLCQEARRFAGHVLLNPERFGQLPPLAPGQPSSLGQYEVRAAVGWAATARGCQAVVDVGEFNPLEVGKAKLWRLSVATEAVGQAVRPFSGDMQLVSSRAKSASSILGKIARWTDDYHAGDERHPLRPMCDLYGFMFRMRPGIDREKIWDIMRQMQQSLKLVDYVAAPDIALDGEAAIATGGNASSVPDLFIQKLRFHLELPEGRVPIEIIMLTDEDYRGYKRTHDEYRRNRRAHR